MPIIGATELQPVNILGSYVQGLEAGRANQLAQRRASQEEQLFSQRMATGQAEQRRAELEARLKGNQIIADMASSAVDQPSYEAALRSLASIGVDVSGIPPMFDPKFVAQQKQLALTEAQRIDAELKRRELGVRERTVSVQEKHATTAAERENRLAAPPRAAGGGAATAPAAAPKEKPPQGYRWTATGNLEAIPGGPKDPNVVSTLTGKKTGGGSEAFEGVIGEMEAAYDELDRLAAIPSTKRSVAENLAISTKTSGFGQMVGRAAGTKEQSLRNQIASARLRLLQGIKAATGMSAQELNSNVELQQWLDAVTNPANDVESNRAILASIRSFVARRAGKEVSADSGKAPETGASIDALLNKYK